MHRNARQQKILELIASKEIDTQEELCYELNKLNFNVTQATISRDIKELKLYKISGTTKKYRYACLVNGDETIHGKMKTLFRECVITSARARLRGTDATNSSSATAVNKPKFPQRLRADTAKSSCTPKSAKTAGKSVSTAPE